jgi:NAD-dependent dihydropyrimidine dehydrogenase PreA subunit
MATVKGVNKTLSDTPDIANRMAPGLFDGRVKIAYDSYECDGLAATSIIEMCPKLPKGAKIIDVILDTDNLTNNATLIVGDYEDDNRYITATDHGAAALITRMNAIDGRMYEIDETIPGDTTTDRQIIITTSVGAATGTIKLIVLYTHD